MGDPDMATAPSDADERACLRRPFGRTGHHFFPLGLGTASFAGVNMIGAETYTRLSSQAIEALMMLAIEAMAETRRVMVDTSAQYGESESRIGEFLAARPGASEQLYLATKWGLRFHPEELARQDYTMENLLASVEASARWLGRIDLLYLHTNPGVTPRTLEEILRGRGGVVEGMREMKRTRRFGIAHLGISASTPQTLELLLSHRDLLDGVDALQLNAGLLLDRVDLARELRRTHFGVVLNSPYRKADRHRRATPEGLRGLYHRVLETHPDAIILTGTRSPAHLRQNVEHVRTWAHLPRLEIRYSSSPPGDRAEAMSDIAADLQSYFAHFALLPETGPVARPAGPTVSPAAASADDVAETIVRVMLGSRKTRLGAAPSPRGRQALHERIRHKVVTGSPIEVILTWGPRKFYAAADDNSSDVAEAAAIERLFDIHRAVEAVYAPGLHVTIFVEDFEGRFIEGVPPAAFARYIESLEALTGVMDTADTIAIVRTSDRLQRPPDRLAEVTARLEQNYDRLRTYWLESDANPEDGRPTESRGAIDALGFVGPITRETRRFYLDRLDRLLGDRITAEQRVDMVLRLLACVLMHRQFDLFRIDPDVEPVKLSFLPIVGGPASLLDGRIDLRVVSRDVSSRTMAPWSAKGYLRRKDGRIVPALKSWREPVEGAARLVRGELRLRRGAREATIRADLLSEAPSDSGTSVDLKTAPTR